MSRRRLYIGAAALAAVGTAGWLVTQPTRIIRQPGSRCIYCGHYTSWVAGRLLDGSTGTPLIGAYLLTLPNESWAQQADTIARYRAHNAERPGRAQMLAAARTGADGRFVVEIEVPWSVTEIDGMRQGPEEKPEPGLGALLVERAGGQPAVVVALVKPRDPGGASGGGLSRAWDLGDVRVPAPK